MSNWNLLAAVSSEWGIGKDGQLLFHIPGDLPRFRERTLGKVVVMGRGTLESLPGGKPLPGRVNLVLSSRGEIKTPAQMREVLAAYPPEDVFIIGGGIIYREFLADCATAYITYVHAAPTADTSMPNLDEHPDWRVTEKTKPTTAGGLTYQFITYSRVG
jgi:dihydrofolate reductase